MNIDLNIFSGCLVIDINVSASRYKSGILLSPNANPDEACNDYNSNGDSGIQEFFRSSKTNELDVDRAVLQFVLHLVADQSNPLDK